MDDRASDFDFQRANLPGLAIVLSKNTNRQYRRFVETLSLHLDGMAKPFGVQKGNNARSHEPQSSIFDNFRQLSHFDLMVRLPSDYLSFRCKLGLVGPPGHTLVEF